VLLNYGNIEGGFTPLTVKTQTTIIPKNTAKKIQPDHAVALKPVYILATITAATAIV
jgi:hypothetical protein